MLYLIKEWFDIKMECWEWICVGLEKTLWLSDPLKLNLLLLKPDKMRSRVSRWREEEWWSASDSISLSIYQPAAKMMHVALTGLFFLSDENSKQQFPSFLLNSTMEKLRKMMTLLWCFTKPEIILCAIYWLQIRFHFEMSRRILWNHTLVWNVGMYGNAIHI